MMTKTQPLSSFMQSGQQRCEHSLDKWLPAQSDHPQRLHEAMRYSVLGGGKRIRPLLTYATGLALGAPMECLDDAAIPVELIHAYSLVHDDLPAMDDDDLRRGKPSCHKAYDEATAILVGDALQALAFEVLATSPQITADKSRQMSACLANASGATGMVGGQMIDVMAENQSLSLDELVTLHCRKTGALIKASVRIAAIASEADEATIRQLADFAELIGLAFQVQDDVLDVEGDTESLGKPAGSDVDNGKATFVQLLGLNEAKKKAQSLLDQALGQLEGFDSQADGLRGLAEFIVHRQS